LTKEATQKVSQRAGGARWPLPFVVVIRSLLLLLLLLKFTFESIHNKRMSEDFGAATKAAQKDQGGKRYRCAKCQKVSSTPLPGCQRCKCVAYCNRDCQVRDIRALLFHSVTSAID